MISMKKNTIDGLDPATKKSNVVSPGHAHYTIIDCVLNLCGLNTVYMNVLGKPSNLTELFV